MRAVRCWFTFCLDECAVTAGVLPKGQLYNQFKVGELAVHLGDNVLHFVHTHTLVSGGYNR